MKKTENNFELETDPSIAGISQETTRNIIKIWKESGDELPVINPDITSKDKKLLLQLFTESIKEEGGEITRLAKVVHLAMIYINLSLKGKKIYLELLAQNFDVNIDILDEKIKNLKSAKDEAGRILAEHLLSDALIPPRVRFLKQLINLPNGFIFLKDMRRDLLPMIKTAPRLKKLSDDIKALLITYFDINLLDLKEITWNSSAALLERLVEYEAVHKISSWKDLKHRLLTDHRVFAFFHYKMPDEPLIFVEVALVNGMSDNIHNLIDINVKPGDPYKADTAIFYSISNTQKGLEGISIGNFLIKRVVKKLSSEFHNLKTFATLSPIPLFRTWLNTYMLQEGHHHFKPDEEKAICKISATKDPNTGLLEILNAGKWYKNKETAEILKKPLLRLCSHFLFNVRKGNGMRAFDPVANFHLSNGAKIEHIHWMADQSKKGIAQSAGIMVNYHYRLDKIEINHENYMRHGKIHASSDARSWLC
jgi:malonyl-CoA decarboxylase